VREVPVNDGGTLGRDADNVVVIDHPSISRHHAELLRASDGSFVVSDLGSLNGARVNGRQIQAPTLIHHGDRITLGEVDLVFLHEAGAPRSHETDHALHSLGVAAAERGEPHEIFAISLACETPACASLAQQLPGAPIQEWIDAWWEEVRSLLERHGADIDPVPRDVLIAYWPVAHREAPASEVNVALRCALDLWILAQEHTRQFSEQFGHASFVVALGLHLASLDLIGAEGREVDLEHGGCADVAMRLARVKCDAPCAGVVSWDLARWAAFGFRFHNVGEVQPSAEAPGGALSVLALDPDGSG